MVNETRVMMLVAYMFAPKAVKEYGALRSIHGYDVLGMCCAVYDDMMSPEHGWRWDVEKKLYSYMGEYCSLPDAVQEWFGFTGEDVLWLTELNDETKKTFNKMAAEIFHKFKPVEKLVD